MLETTMLETMNRENVVRVRGLFSIKDVREKAKAFKRLMGRDPKVFIMGRPFDCRDLKADFWPASRAKVAEVRHKFLRVDHHGDVFDIFCPADGPHADIRSDDSGFYFDLQ